MTSRDLKSISYAFVANDINIYIPDNEDDCFIAEKLVCTKCNSPWHTSLLECYFCGELNYYLYRCTACGKKYSITNSNVKCSCGNSDSKLIKACVNEECPTNTNEIIRNLALKEGGVFNLSSTFNLSLNYCVKCGSVSNYYKTFRTFVFNKQKYSCINHFLEDHDAKKGNLLLFKDYVGGNLKYGYSIYEPENDSLPLCNYDKIQPIINELFFKVEQ